MESRKRAEGGERGENSEKEGTEAGGNRSSVVYNGIKPDGTQKGGKSDAVVKD